MKLTQLLKKTSSPDARYRPVPFWSFNDELETKELIWQVGQQKDAGLGGYFLHARSGLRTKYMSEEWMHALEVCIEEGHRLGIYSWLYDENGWPSGFADGAVPQKGEYYMQKSLQFTVAAAAETEIDRFTLALFTAGPEGKYVDEIADLPKDTQVLQVRYALNPYYSDLLSADVVRDFIVTTYDVYYERFGQYFGKQIPGIFTDEPQYGRYAMAWSNHLEEDFLRENGYSLKKNLNALYYPVEGYQKVRYDYHRLLSSLFSSNYAGQISAWCEEHGVQLTGHVLFEEDCAFQCSCTGSDMMFYETMHLPGIDWLGNHIGNPIVQKQVASVADQMGRNRVICEMYGGGTWSMTPQDLKWITEFNMVNGVNMICSHLEAYSLRGMRKRDWPPSVYYHQPWWSQVSGMHDYFSRICMLLSEGKTCTDVLVVHPLHSVWMEFDHHCFANHTNERSSFIDRNFEWVCNTLSMNQFEYHLGDEYLMAKYGKVEGQQLRMNHCVYDTVVIPPAYSLDEPVYQLLMRFAENGGKLLCFPDFPTCIDGKADSRTESLKALCVLVEQEEETFVTALSDLSNPLVTMKDAGMGQEYHRLHHAVKAYEDGYLVYIVNTNKDSYSRANIRFCKEGFRLAGCYCAETDVFTPCSGEWYPLDLAPAGSTILIYRPEVSDGEAGSTVPNCRKELSFLSAEPVDMNALLLDYCTITSEDIEDIPRMHFLEIQKKLIRHGKDIRFSASYDFSVVKVPAPDKRCFLLVETPEVYQSITVNGIAVDLEPRGWMLDNHFALLDIRGMLQSGENEVKLIGVFRNNEKILRKYLASLDHEEERNTLTFDSELEAVYVVGDFAVIPASETYQPGARATAVAEKLVITDIGAADPENITVSGYPFYRGAFRLRYRLDLVETGKTVLAMEKPFAHMVSITVNDRKVTTRMWEPFKADISDFVHIGKNEIELVLYSSNRNFLGHHHHPNRDLDLLAPELFDQKSGFTDEYAFVRFGINGSPWAEIYKG